MPTTPEWARFTKYGRRMRELKVDLSQEPIPSNVLSVLQLRSYNEPLLSNLKSLALTEVTTDVIPFIPLFLHRGTTCVKIEFDDDPPAAVVAAMIVNLPKLCPHLQLIRLDPLPRNPIITDATSEMFLTCNLDALIYLQIDSTFTEKACRIVFQLPKLRVLWLILTQPITLPDVSLPNLIELDIEFHHGHEWLRAFRTTTLSELTEVTFRAQRNQVGNFLEAFEDVALATSASTTLSIFRFYTSLSWNPSYYSLLAFTQLKELVIEFSCRGGCSSTIDDEVLITLCRAMPQLEVLQIGGQPCRVPGGVTTHGLIALAHRCRNLSKLRIHFQMDSLVLALTAGDPQPSQKMRLLREASASSNALTTLEVGKIHLPQPHALMVFLTLTRIFPRLGDIKYIDEGWKWVADSLKLSQQVDSLVRCSGEALHLTSGYS